MIRKINRFWKIGLAVVVLLMVLFFLFRNTVLGYAIRKVTEKLYNRNGIVLKINGADFNGFTTVGLYGISVVPPKGDTLLTADTITIRPSVWTLFAGTLRLKEVHGSGIHLTLEAGRKVNNIRFPRPEHKKDTTAILNRNFAGLLSSMLDRSFNFAPQRSALSNIQFTYRNDTLERDFHVDYFHADEGSLEGEGIDQVRQQKWKCTGNFSQTSHHFDVYFYPVESTHSQVPLLQELTGMMLEFDSLHLVLDGYRYHSSELKANGLLSVEGLSVYHKKVSEDTVRVPSASISYSFTAGSDYLMLDSTSAASLGQIQFNPYLRLQAGAKGKQFAFNINSDGTSGTSFFKSLPEGMFDEVRGIEADGKLAFRLRFAIDTSKPDSLQFDCSMKRDHFRLKKIPPGSLLKMNSEFIQPVYEYDRYVRSFAVGLSNPDYTPLTDISPYFQHSVLTSEDGNFYYHNGFNEDAFRKSIATNFKAGKFLRGGSTISMQLIKNVFLNRKKNIGRKAEEALIVWLIESNRLTSKERMFEVYMNIIELGPNVYGIGEASRFYFNKRPIQLNLEESIFLASLLPHPKWFRYSFDQSGQLKPYLADYYRVMSNFMLRKNLITQEEHDKLLPQVTITGPAKESIIITTDTIQAPPQEELEIENQIN